MKKFSKTAAIAALGFAVLVCLPGLAGATTGKATNYIGINNADNAALTDSVVSNADGSMLERLEYVQANIITILADTAGLDTAAEVQSLAGTAAVSTTGITGAPTANTLADTLHKDGSFTYDNTTDSLEAISVALAAGTGATAAIDADNLDHLASTTTGIAGDGDLTGIVADLSIFAHIMAIGADTSDYSASTDSLEAIGDAVAAILTDTAGLDSSTEVQTLAFGTATGGADILADTAAMQPSSPMCVSKTLTTIMAGNNDLFVVSGPVKVVEIIGIVATEIEAKGCLINYNLDPTVGADVAFGTDGTALEINADAAGTLYTWTGVIAADLLATTAGTALGMPTESGIILPAGSLELAADVVTSATGAIAFHVRYVPLTPGATVTAAP